MKREPKAPLDKSVVKKNVSVIHINAKLSLIQRKLVNALLYNAYDHLLSQDTHSLNVALLSEMIGFDSRNLAHLKTALTGLVETSIQWDVLEDNGSNSWEVATLLSFARIREGTCSYRYDKSLADKLYHPDIYSKINLSVIRDMRSSHALVLYENCHRYIEIGHTAWWDLNTFRKLMSINDINSYQEFKSLNRNVIKPAIAEVNKLSNIQVELETRQKGRTVTGLRFLLKSSPQLSMIGMDDPDEVNQSSVYKVLVQEGISKALARSWTLEHSEGYILSKVELSRNHALGGKIKTSKSGFLKTAIEQDYSSEMDVEREKAKVVEEARVLRRSKEIELKKVQDLKLDLEATYRVQCIQLIDQEYQNLEDEDRKQLLVDFSASILSDFLRKEFSKRVWKTRGILSDAVSFWKGRGLPLPSLEEFYISQAAKTVNEIQARIAELENELS